MVLLLVIGCDYYVICTALGIAPLLVSITT